MSRCFCICSFSFSLSRTRLPLITLSTLSRSLPLVFCISFRAHFTCMFYSSKPTLIQRTLPRQPMLCSPLAPRPTHLQAAAAVMAAKAKAAAAAVAASSGLDAARQAGSEMAAEASGTVVFACEAIIQHHFGAHYAHTIFFFRSSMMYGKFLQFLSFSHPVLVSEAVANAAGKVLSHASAEQVCGFTASLFGFVCLFVQICSIVMNCLVFHRKQIQMFIKNKSHTPHCSCTYHISLSHYSPSAFVLYLFSV